VKARYSIVAALALVAVLAAPSRAGVVLPPLDPNYVTGLVSLNSDTEATILFNNQTSFDVNVYWIDYFGAEVFYVTIPAGNSHLQGTYLTHPWLIRRVSDNSPLVGFLPVTAAPWTSGDFDTANITEQPIPVQESTWGGVKALFGR
jgi:hypothetical protein